MCKSISVSILLYLLAFMKIWIVASGFEMLPLFTFLNQYEHEYHIFWDWKYWPWGDKSDQLVQKRIHEGCFYLDKLWVDIIIVPPIAELRVVNWDLRKKILPLFQTYLFEYVLKYSLVGKLWLLCDHSDMVVAQSLLEPLIKKYTLSKNQKNTKKFYQDFPMWKKEIRMWKYFLSTYGARNPMVRKTIKHDLRYLRDAAVDTIVPMSWGFLFYDKMIQSRLNWKKVRFHGLDTVQQCFLKIMKSDEIKIKSDETKYWVTLHCTDSPEILLNEKKWMWVLGKGKRVKVKVEMVG